MLCPRRKTCTLGALCSASPALPEVSLLAAAVSCAAAALHMVSHATAKQCAKSFQAACSLWPSSQVDLYLKVTVSSCLQVMTLQEENLAYVAAHDPARALQEYRRRKAAIPQQTVHAPVPKQEEKSDSAASTEVKHHLRVLAVSLYMQI